MTVPQVLVRSEQSSGRIGVIESVMPPGDPGRPSGFDGVSTESVLEGFDRELGLFGELTGELGNAGSGERPAPHVVDAGAVDPDQGVGGDPGLQAVWVGAGFVGEQLGKRCRVAREDLALAGQQGGAVGDHASDPLELRVGLRRVAVPHRKHPSWREDEAGEGSQRRFPALASADGSEQLRLERLQAAVEEILLGRKVVEDRLHGDIGLAGNIRDRRGFEPALDEQPPRGLGDRPARALLLALTPAQGLLGLVWRPHDMPLSQLQLGCYSKLVVATVNAAMPVLPELEPLLAQIRVAGSPERATPVAQRREQVHAGIDRQLARVVEPVPAAPHSDHHVSVRGGEITVRVYRPGGAEPVGVHLFVHGGGWWMGTLDQSDLACSRIVSEVGCAVASVDHRWAPEHRFPAPAEDCYAALEWVAATAVELGLDPGRISVGGVSSGANLAAAVTLMARDRGGPDVIAQCLEVPMLDLTMSQASIDELADGYMLTRERLALEVADYCDPEQRSGPYASPLLTPDLTGLPPALIATTEYDLLRDDGEQYAARLTAAGVPATAVRWPGHLHGSLAMTRLAPSAADWHQRQHAFLRHRHAQTEGTT